MIQPVPAIGTPATLPLSMIRADAQIRMRNGFDQESLDGLASTIRQHGLIQPIVVRMESQDSYVVVAGERRLIACSMAGLVDVPVLIREWVGDAGDITAVQTIENLQREALTLADLAEGVASLVKSYGSAQAAAQALGKSVPWVRKHASMLTVHADVKPILLEGITQDLELVHTLNQIRKLKDGAGVEAFRALAKGIDDGTTTRAKARKVLESLKERSDVTPTGEDDGEQEGGEDAGEDAAHHLIKLPLSPAQLTKLTRLGGAGWFLTQLDAAE